MCPWTGVKEKRAKFEKGSYAFKQFVIEFVQPSPCGYVANSNFVLLLKEERALALSFSKAWTEV